MIRIACRTQKQNTSADTLPTYKHILKENPAEIITGKARHGFAIFKRTRGLSQLEVATRTDGYVTHCVFPGGAVRGFLCCCFLGGFLPSLFVCFVRVFLCCLLTNRDCFCSATRYLLLTVAEKGPFLALSSQGT